MIAGKVNRDMEACIVVEAMNVDGQFQSIETVLDTGFSGFLTLPTDLIRRLELEPEGVRLAQLANGEIARMDSWLCTVIWHGRPHSIQVLQADGEPLPGMRMLRGSRVIVDALEGGDVIVEELPLSRVGV